MPFRASRSTRSGRPGAGQATDADIFDGLPVRQWRLQTSTVGGTTTTEDDPSNPTASNNQLADPSFTSDGTPELPMPKGSEQYMPWCYKLLRAARAGRGNASSKTSEVQKQIGVAPGASTIRPDSDKENANVAAQEEKDTDTPFGPRGTKRGAAQGFMALRWMQVPKTQETPDREHLAKRRKGLAPMHAIPDPSTTAHMRKTKVKRTDAEGHDTVFEVMVPRGTKVEGEIREEVTLENAAAAIAAPKAGTVVQGLGVANEEGIVIATQGIAALESRKKGVPVPRRRKKRGGPGKWQVKLSDMTTGGVSASAEALEERKRAEAGLSAGGTRTEAEKQAGGEEEEGESEEDGEEGDDDREEGELSDTPAQDAGAGAEEPMLLDEPYDPKEGSVEKPPEATSRSPATSKTRHEHQRPDTQPQHTQLSPPVPAHLSIPSLTSPRPHPRIPGLTVSASHDDSQRTSAPPVQPPSTQQQRLPQPKQQPEPAPTTADADSDDDPYASYTDPATDPKPKPPTNIEASTYPEYDSDPEEEPSTIQALPARASSNRHASPVNIAEDTIMTDTTTIPPLNSKPSDGALAESLQVSDQPVPDSFTTDANTKIPDIEQPELQSAEQEAGTIQQGREEEANPTAAQTAQEGGGQDAATETEDDIMDDVEPETQATDEMGVEQSTEVSRMGTQKQQEDKASIARSSFRSSPSSAPSEPQSQLPHNAVPETENAPSANPTTEFEDKPDTVAPASQPSEPQQQTGQAQPPDTISATPTPALAEVTAEVPSGAPPGAPPASSAGLPPRQPPGSLTSIGAALQSISRRAQAGAAFSSGEVEDVLLRGDGMPMGDDVPTEDVLLREDAGIMEDVRERQGQAYQSQQQHGPQEDEEEGEGEGNGEGGVGEEQEEQQEQQEQQDHNQNQDQTQNQEQQPTPDTPPRSGFVTPPRPDWEYEAFTPEGGSP